MSCEVTYRFDPIHENLENMGDPEYREWTTAYYKRRVKLLKVARDEGIITHRHWYLEHRRCRVECEYAGIAVDVFRNESEGETMRATATATKATVTFSAEDVQGIFDMTLEEANKWLSTNKNRIQDRMCQGGYEAIEMLGQMDDLTLNDVE